jgi:phosphatidylserine/phosphatidylglycerophosphate/cardiolipin synthase-like enzyme
MSAGPTPSNEAVAARGRALRMLVWLGACLVLAACATSPRLARRAEAVVAAARPSEVTCHADDRCALPTPFAALIDRARQAEAAGRPRHYVGLLERGEESLALRLHLIRAARERIDIQTFILSDDASGLMVLDELLAAARRGVQVRLLSDQLFSLDDTTRLARLAQAHANFELRLYNPTFDEARTAAPEFLFGIVCCFSRFNQRMHNKLLVVDRAIGMTGGRNLDDRYVDWSTEYNYRDRDVWVVGPAAAAMAESFDEYWADDTAVPLTRLRDVARKLVRNGDGTPGPAPANERVGAVQARADDAGWIRERFVERAFPVERVEYFADAPGKDNDRAEHDLERRIAALFAAAEDRIVLQTPYLVLSRAARRLIRERRAAHPKLRVEVSTNSLAATDAFYVYAISYKYKRYYLKRLGLEIYEYRPFPDGSAAPPPPAWPSVSASGSGSGARSGASRQRVKGKQPAPLVRPGVRRSQHAKSIVIDGRVALIGSHNFDPRSDELNTESGLIVWDEAFAQALEVAIRYDMAPSESWVIAPRRLVPVVEQVNTAIAGVSETLPIFDLWPFRYATSYAIKPGCEPLRVTDPRFAECYEAVGDFPEVALSMKQIYTRIIAAFGIALVPIL